MNSKLLVPLLVMACVSAPAMANQVCQIGLYGPQCYCGGILVQPYCIGLCLPHCTIGQCGSVMMVSTCQILGGGPCSGIQTHSVMSCHLGGPCGTAPQLDCTMSLVVNGQQVVLLHVP